ncbi:MAG: tRNA 2-thiouridine(34) synthase MnmA [bacterium]
MAPHQPRGRRVVVAMSGGVDSSVAAALLAEEGYEVIGVGLQVWDYGASDAPSRRFGSCCAPTDFADARRVAESLGVPFYLFDVEEVFREAVVDPFVASYAEGRTPNPCVSCNQRVKFDYLMERALALGADMVATGHYASVVRDRRSGRLAVSRGVDRDKDQSYYLFDLSQDQLARIVFPLSGLTKEQVRQKARQLGLVVADKPESQEICFISDGDTAGFVARQLGEDAVGEGEVVSAEGTVVGRHRGYAYYTVGQRRGLGVAAGLPLYVTHIDPATNRLEVGPDEALWRRRLDVGGLTWALPPAVGEPARLEVQIRSRHGAAPAAVERLSNGQARVTFEDPQRAIAPGQAAVLYAGDVVVGGGWIEPDGV